MALSEKTVKINGFNVHYYEQGNPEMKSVLLLHGGLGDAWLNWSDTMHTLGQEYYVIAPDLPGYGQSEVLPNMTLNALVNWVGDFIAALGIEQTALIGHSFGGLVARIFASEHPANVPALVLVNGGVIPSVPGLVKFVTRIPVLGTQLFNRIGKSTTSRSSVNSALKIHDTLKDDFYNRIQTNAAGLSAMMHALTISPPPEKKTPRVPVLMIWGEEDSVTPLKSGQAIHKNIPGAQFSPIAECGHMPHIEAQDVFIWQVKNFLNALNRGRQSAGAAILDPKNS